MSDYQHSPNTSMFPDPFEDDLLDASGYLSNTLYPSFSDQDFSALLKGCGDQPFGLNSPGEFLFDDTSAFNEAEYQPRPAATTMSSFGTNTLFHDDESFSAYDPVILEDIIQQDESSNPPTRRHTNHDTQLSDRLEGIFPAQSPSAMSNRPRDPSMMTDDEYESLNRNYHHIFESLEHMQRYRNEKKGPVAWDASDRSCPLNYPDLERAYQKQLYLAIRDGRKVGNFKPGEPKNKQPKSYKFCVYDKQDGGADEAVLQLRAWEFLEALLDAHKHGQEWSQTHVGQDTTFHSRYLSFRECLVREKDLAKRLLPGPLIDEVISDPATHLNRVQANRGVNEKKGRAIQEGRKILGHAVKSKAQPSANGDSEEDEEEFITSSSPVAIRTRSNTRRRTISGVGPDRTTGQRAGGRGSMSKSLFAKRTRITRASENKQSNITLNLGYGPHQALSEKLRPPHEPDTYTCGQHLLMFFDYGIQIDDQTFTREDIDLYWNVKFHSFDGDLEFPEFDCMVRDHGVWNLLGTQYRGPKFATGPFERMWWLEEIGWVEKGYSQLYTKWLSYEDDGSGDTGVQPNADQSRSAQSPGQLEQEANTASYSQQPPFVQSSV